MKKKGLVPEPQHGHRFATFWSGGDLGQYEVLSLKSFISSTSVVELYTYEPPANVPTGVQLLDASGIVPAGKHRLVDGFGSRAGFSNYFRYNLIAQQDVIWFDTDMVRTGPVEKRSGYTLGWEGFGRVNGAMLGYPSDSNFADFLLQECTSRMAKEYKWGALGPALISEAVSRFRIHNLVQAEKTFYPIRMREVWKIFDSAETAGLRDRLVKSSAVHLWNELLRNSGPKVKEALPPMGSLAAFLLDSFQVIDQTHQEMGLLDTHSPAWQAWRNKIGSSSPQHNLSLALGKVISRLDMRTQTRLNRIFLELRRL